MCERSRQYPISSDASKRSLQRECYSTVKNLAVHGLFANFSFYVVIQAISERMTIAIAYPIHNGTGTFPSPRWQG
jgi:multidrug transporter EmrE-like cation transporter